MLKFERSFITIWFAQAISILGSSLTTFGISVWIYEQTGKVTPVAISILCAVLPVILLATIVGNVVDHFNRKWVIILADTGAALTSLTLAVCIFTGYFNIYILYAVILISAGCNFFHSTAFEASITSMVPKEQLKSANGLLQITDSINSLLMPIVAGIFYGLIGLSGMVIIDLGSYIISICILIIGIPSSYFAIEKGTKVKYADKSRFKEMGKGFKFIYEKRGFTLLVCLFALVNFFMNLSTVLLTPIALTIGASTQLGVIQSIGGAGMLVGSLIATLPGLKISYMKHIKYCIGIVGVCLVGMGLYTSVIGLSIGRFICLMCVPISNTAAITMWQLKTPKEMQGRVFATRSLIIRSCMPLAYIIVGPLTDSILPKVIDYIRPMNAQMINSAFLGNRLIFLLSGCMLLMINLLFFRNHNLRNLEELPNCI